MIPIGCVVFLAVASWSLASVLARALFARCERRS